MRDFVLTVYVLQETTMPLWMRVRHTRPKSSSPKDARYKLRWINSRTWEGSRSHEDDYPFPFSYLWWLVGYSCLLSYFVLPGALRSRLVLSSGFCFASLSSSSLAWVFSFFFLFFFLFFSCGWIIRILRMFTKEFLHRTLSALLGKELLNIESVPAATGYCWPKKCKSRGVKSWRQETAVIR